MTTKEIKTPKAYLYAVEGFLNEDDSLVYFSIPSLNRDLEDEFDLERLACDAALRFYLKYEEYQTLDKWPLNFKFYLNKNSVVKELEMNLNFSPQFMSTPKKIIKETKKITTASTTEKKTRKPRSKKETNNN